MVCLGARLVFLHLGPHDEALADIVESRQWVTELPVERGKVFDQHGDANILVLDVPAKDVCANPDAVVSNKQVAFVAAELSRLLDTPAAEITAKLDRPGREYACIRAALPTEEAERIEALRLPGVFMKERTVRYYPHHDFLCHVLGFVNLAGDGSAGVEQRMDRFLKGSRGLLESKKNALREELYFKRGRYVPAVQGADVYLTIDQYAQYIMEKALDDIAAGQTVHWQGAWAIMQNVRTGEILAMASRPSYDLNHFRTANELERRNGALAVVYEPGSTLKAITFAAALNEGLTTPETVIHCENGKWMHRNRLLRDHHAEGRLTVADGLKKSSNILTAKLAVQLGDQRLFEYMRAFGLGRKLGIDLPGEEAGILPAVSAWSPISASRMAIGQGVAVTALQLITIYSTIANDGVMMRPYVVQRVVAKDGTVLDEQHPEELGRPIRTETAATMRRLLARVTEPDGTGKRAAVAGYSVAGKTGTAQKPVGGRYSSTDHMASFVGFLPAEKPEIAIVVVVDNPQPLHTGGQVAAPIFQRIASETARYMGLPSAEQSAVAMR